MHREEQILQAAVTAIEAVSGLNAAVFAHKTLTLSGEDQEMPAVCVNNGSDDPTDSDGAANLAYVDSLASLQFTVYAQASTQEDVATELDRLRVAVHQAMMASPRTLSLSFVTGIQYGGAQEPEYSTSGSPLAGRRTSTFAVMYRMNIADPS